jgi:hypothetical protein
MVRLGLPTSIREGGNGAAITTSIGVAAAMAREGGSTYVLSIGLV